MTKDELNHIRQNIAEMKRTPIVVGNNIDAYRKPLLQRLALVLLWRPAFPKGTK